MRTATPHGELLRDGGEQIPAALAGVHDAIINTDTPRSALNWLRQGAGARLLADLATGDLPCTYQALDAHLQARAADYLRHMLVAGGALCPPETEALVRLESWVSSTLLAEVTNPSIVGCCRPTRPGACCVACAAEPPTSRRPGPPPATRAPNC